MKKLLTILLVVAAVSPALAQSDDFGLWTTLGAQKDLNKQWTVSAGTEVRFEDNVSKVTPTQQTVKQPDSPASKSWNSLRALR